MKKSKINIQTVVNAWLVLEAAQKPKDNVFISKTIKYILYPIYNGLTLHSEVWPVADL